MLPGKILLSGSPSSLSNQIEYQYEQVRFQEYNGGILLRRSYHRDLSGPVFLVPQNLKIQEHICSN
mgnify:FL=1